MAKTSPARSTTKFILPDLPREKWCDFRVGYSEHNKTLVQLAEEYMCDPRTVRSCLLRNKPSSSLGKKTVPTQIDLYRDESRRLWKKRFRSCRMESGQSISSAASCCLFSRNVVTRAVNGRFETTCISIQE